MAMYNLFTKEEQINLAWELRKVIQDYEFKNVPKNKRRYFSKFAEKYGLVERLEREIEQYQSGALEGNPTSDVEIANFFEVQHYSVQSFLNNRMDSRKKNIKANACLEIGRENGWFHLRGSGKIPALEGRVREAAILAIKEKWGKK